MKKCCFVVVFIVMSLISNVVWGETGAAPHQNEIICKTAVTEQNVQIDGQIQGVEESHQVALLVGEEDNIIYIDQVTSNADGRFCFKFMLPDSLKPGEYRFHVGSDADAGTYEGVLLYAGNPDARQQFMDADVTISKKTTFQP